MFGLNSQDSLLPPLKIKKSAAETKIANWATTKTRTTGILTNQTKSQIDEVLIQINTKSLPYHADSEPNFYKMVDILEIDDKPLSNANRGEVDGEIQIRLPATKTSSSALSIPQTLSLDHYLEIQNNIDVCMSMFRTIAGKVQYGSLNPYESISIKSNTQSHDTSYDGRSSYGNINQIKFVNLGQVAVSLTTADEIEEITFNQGLLGLEVVKQDDSIICSSVLEGSQASRMYGQSLVGVEIISVNNRRVLTLEAFTDALINSQHLHEIYFRIIRRNEYIRKLELTADKVFVQNDIVSKERISRSSSKYQIDSKHTSLTTSTTDIVHRSRDNRQIRDAKDDDNALLAPIANDISSQQYRINKEDNEDSNSRFEEGNEERWNFPTHVDISDPIHSRPIHYIQLLCHPFDSYRSQQTSHHDNSSHGNSFMIVNNSKNWHVHLYWIDTAAIFIHRLKLQAGSKHIETINNAYYWAVVVTPFHNNDNMNRELITRLDSSHAMLFKLKTWKKMSTFKPHEEYIWSPMKSITLRSTCMPSKANSQMNVQYAIRIID